MTHRRKPATYSRLIKRAAASQVRNRPPLPGWAGGGFMGGYRAILPGADYDYGARAGDLAANTAVAACLNVLNPNFSEPRLQVERKGKDNQDEVVEGHPLPALMNRPNPFFDRFTFDTAIQTSLQLDGNAYILKVRSGAGIPVELWWIPVNYLYPVWYSENSWIDAYRYLPEYGGGEIDPKDIIHLRWGTPDPATSYRTHISPLRRAGCRVICSLNEADGFTASILRNMGVPSAVISPDSPNGKIQKDQAVDLMVDWRQRMTGENRGTPLIATGPIKVTPVQMTPEQLALNTIPGRLEQVICALMGVPAIVAGVPGGNETKTYANAEAAIKGLYSETIIPIQKSVAEVLYHQLLGDPGIGDPSKEMVVYNYENIPCMAEAADAIFKRATDGYAKGVLKRSVALEMVGLHYEESDEVYSFEPVPPGQEAEAKPGEGGPGPEEPKPDEAADAETEPEEVEPSKAAQILTTADELATNVPVPVNDHDANVLAKAVDTLDMIRASLTRHHAIVEPAIEPHEAWAADGPGSGAPDPIDDLVVVPDAVPIVSVAPSDATP